ncbi:MAG: hypothetical protein O2951_08125 [Bacteroidetes bacterium]|nr:hypothetical protein [Bacteroidota bacterium]
MKNILIIVFSLLIVSTELFGQVGEVSKGARGNKENTRKSSEGSDRGYSGGGGSCVFFFLEIFDVINIIGRGQKDQLAQRFEQPYRVSLKAGLNGGYYNGENTFIFLPSIRGNWGLFSTHFRSNWIQDLTGQFQTLDWQVIQMNIVNTPGFTLRAGTGFSHVKDIDDTYHESTVGFVAHFDERRINPGIEFRWSNDYSTDEVPRFEINTQVDYEIMQSGKFRINVMGGYLYQSYIGDEIGEHIPFHFLQTGINLYFQ